MNISAIGPALSLLQPTPKQSASEMTGDFAAKLADIGTQAIDAVKLAENNALSALSGNASARDVVDAVMSAEQSLQIAIGIRDKIVSSYLEISRMAI